MSNSRAGKVNKILADYKKKRPYCELHANGTGPDAFSKLVVADHVHHIDPVGSGGASKDSTVHNENNLISLCVVCHDFVHRFPGRGKEMCLEASFDQEKYDFIIDVIKEHSL